MIRIVIIEDEKLTADDLRNTIVEVDSGNVVVAMLRSVDEATAYFNNGNADYDLIFSDIQLSDGLCFDIFRNSVVSRPVIFCTAYDEYALKAFRANGIEYLLKPFSRASVQMALNKYHSLLNGFVNVGYSYDALVGSNGYEPDSEPKLASILVHKADKIIPIGVHSIAVVFLDQRRVFALTFDGVQYMLSQSLATVIELCGTDFFRANRQFLVNRKAIKNVSRRLNRKLVVNLNVSFEPLITVGKLKIKPFMNWMSGV